MQSLKDKVLQFNYFNHIYYYPCVKVKVIKYQINEDEERKHP